MDVSCDAVVVGRLDTGDSDRVIRLLTAQRGRVSVMARRARSSRGVGALLEVGNLVHITYRQGRGDLGTYREAKALAVPNRARGDLHRIAALAYGCEVVPSLATEGAEAERLFRLLVAWGDVLENGAHVGSGLRVALEAKALTFAGLFPTLGRCVRCGEPISAPARLSPELGGPTHSRCGGEVAWNPDLAGAIDTLRRTPLATIAAADEAAVLPTWSLSDLIAWHAGREHRSRSLLEQMETEG